jgi:sulfite exporter TauE/SafE
MLWAAFITGLIGSLHCTGMCGPLICAMPINRDTRTAQFFSLVVYNTGRIFSYAILGILSGTGGLLISMLTGRWYTLSAGVLLLILGILKLVRPGAEWFHMPAFMRRWTGRLFRSKSPWVLPLLGLFNGFIPCGAAYAALAGAMATGSPDSGASYMLVFGLATWPALFASYYMSGFFLQTLKRIYRPATAMFLCILGVLLVLRALNTPLPESPEITQSAVCR